MNVLTVEDEKRLRELAVGIAKDVEDSGKLLARLGFTHEEYEELTQTRTFKTILKQAQDEWEGASNTHKRIKLKAAINVEEALPSFYQGMVDVKEPLSSRVKALEVVARIGGLGNPEIQAAGAGQFFKLEINLGAGKAPLIIENSAGGIPDGPYSESDGDGEDRTRPSALFSGMALEEL